MFVYVGGIPGVGKTTVITEILKIAQKTNFSLQGLEETKILCKLSRTNSRKEYLLLEEDKRAAARKLMAAYFQKLDLSDLDTIRIRDDHFTYLQEDETFLIASHKTESRNSILAFVVITAEPKIILNRRMNELNLRPGRNFKLDNIVRHQNLEIQTAITHSTNFNLPILIIENQEGQIATVAEFITYFIEASVIAKKGEG